MEITDLDFSDIFVTADPRGSHYKVTPDASIVSFFEETYFQDVQAFRLALEHTCQEKGGNPQFNIIWKGAPMRAVRMDAADGSVFVCRNFKKQTDENGLKTKPQFLSEIGYPKKMVEVLVSDKIKNGIIMLMGQPGSWKSTSAAGLLIERLELHGGVAWTLERPIERLLSGRHKGGVCHQVEVKSDEDFGPEIEKVVRAGSNILFIGEVRNESAARQAVLAAAGGLIVILTFHAASLLTGLKRFARLCGEVDLFAENMAAAVHLSLESKAEQQIKLPGMRVPVLPGKSVMRDFILHTEPLFTVKGFVSPDDANNIKNFIRASHSPDSLGIDGLKTLANAQRQSFHIGENLRPAG